jgi:hypothetical protein
MRQLALLSIQATLVATPFVLTWIVNDRNFALVVDLHLN